MEDLDMGMYRNIARGQEHRFLLSVTRIRTLFMMAGDICHSF